MRACIPQHYHDDDDDEDEEATAADKAEVPDAQDGQEWERREMFKKELRWKIAKLRCVLFPPQAVRLSHSITYWVHRLWSSTWQICLQDDPKMAQYGTEQRNKWRRHQVDPKMTQRWPQDDTKCRSCQKLANTDWNQQNKKQQKTTDKYQPTKQHVTKQIKYVKHRGSGVSVQEFLTKS